MRIDARVRGKLASGFKHTEAELKSTNTNQLGLIMPMLATHEKNNKRFLLNDCYVQPKLDGHRCLVNNSLAYSRGGKQIDTIPEIQSALNLPEGVTIDGELYLHGASLQRISSLAKRRQEGTKDLMLHVYDIVVEGVPFKERIKMLQEIVPETLFTTIVATPKFNPSVDLNYCYTQYRELGYEGAILRPSGGMYEPGKRSKTLLKVKRRFDAEFLCIDVISSREGLGILVLKDTRGNPFKTVAPGNNHMKKITLNNKKKFIGRYVTCEYAELSDTQVPQHCVAMRWRSDI